ncbi:hypothetical protein A2686_03970 [Candidatus Woesebacteria bacterium RIFCSPHIGHO2_01_FULL_38_10]|uniref:EfeO-type cupredoxin-like domain-containing protein n=1 Tax=Candidatus Woesebacteria bacterium RIFCSPLOWO2_01_FULL_39_10b TaxID=1802517 RepID=A0A1F8B7I7_9BACT|nr:MAG: hypothetical protein A2686_03970 [Candidatus Woesebacteria bacterium RIFCSPHIGHO2_01_FULL_38_10]OGM60004.1 MAG: hypothetical protein A2892_03855 [Candidatus Woesebacteria bacterium RIFCSPLOWO2_01_FULL_39_10b]
MDKVVVTLGGFFLIAFIWWFFFGKKPPFVEATEGKETVDIIVDGGYKPANVKLKVGKTTRLVFIRKDSNSCLEEVVIPFLRIKKYLPLNKPVEIELVAKEKGKFGMHCGMNMFHGKIIVS